MKNMYFGILLSAFYVSTVLFVAEGYKDVWLDVECDEVFKPKNCDFNRIRQPTGEDYERCAPAHLPLYARNYILGAAGRGLTYKDNREAFERIKLKPKMLRDTSNPSLETSTLNQNVAFPIGIAATGLHKLANFQGEKATVEAASELQTIMILSSMASIPLEDVAQAANGAHLWIQVYIFQDRSITMDIVRRAEKSGYRAIVLTVDSNVVAQVRCDAKHEPSIMNAKLPNMGGTIADVKVASITFEDIKWLKTVTKLPIIAKGILTGDDAKKAIMAGASGIFVSNHGGRQLDGVQATIDALPSVVKAVRNLYPVRDVYLDGGVRNGFDVYKAIARGAKMVFLGRPVLYGLTLGGKEGVKKVFNIMKNEFVESMVLSGSSHPRDITIDTVIPQYPGNEEES